MTNEKVGNPFTDPDFLGAVSPTETSPDDVSEQTDLPVNDLSAGLAGDVSGMTFIKLDDCPDSYAKKKGKFVRVLPSESGLTFDTVKIDDVPDLRKIINAVENFLEFYRRFCRLGDRDKLASDWTSASLANKNYLYLCDETTSKFSNGDSGKKFLEY